MNFGSVYSHGLPDRQVNEERGADAGIPVACGVE